MSILTCFNLRFTPSWLIIILSFLFISLFSTLGVWQIHRAHEKSQMMVAEQERANQNAINWQSKKRLPDQYQRLTVKGHYLTKVFLLDNQHQQHQFGYNVLSPLVLSDGSVAMVDRGWILGGSTRQFSAEIETPKQALEIHGIAYFPSNKQWVLGQGLEEKEHNITIIEALDTKLLSQVLQKRVYPFIIRLDKSDDYGFVRQWAVVSMPPQRHLAYATQWFAMALIILILFVALNLKKNNEEKCN